MSYHFFKHFLYQPEIKQFITQPYVNTDNALNKNILDIEPWGNTKGFLFLLNGKFILIATEVGNGYRWIHSVNTNPIMCISARFDNWVRRGSL